MVVETFHDILAQAGFVTTPASPEFLTWLAANKVPREIIELLASGVPKRQERRRRLCDSWDLLAEREIQKEAEDFPRYLKAGLLSIASCKNGDPVALNLRRKIGAVGYISHEEVWGDEDVRMRDYFVVVAPS